MQTPFVKMMSRISEIENYILKGLVLDEHGAWIPIADKKAVEEDFLAHLMAGQVLHEGRWVSIAEAKSARAPTEIATLEMPLQETREKPAAHNEQHVPSFPTTFIPEHATTPENLIEETQINLPPLQALLSSGSEGLEFPPETKTIYFDRSPESDSDTQAPTPLDPLSGFAPETGAFVFEQPGENGQTKQDDGSESLYEIQKESSLSNSSTTSLLLPAVASWEQSARKRHLRILVFGSIGVALAGAAAIFILVFQLTH
jgi:hypothetical protein